MRSTYFSQKKNKKAAEAKSIVQQPTEKSQELILQRADGTAFPLIFFDIR
jgi:hypothetical protein